MQKSKLRFLSVPSILCGLVAMLGSPAASLAQSTSLEQGAGYPINIKAIGAEDGESPLRVTSARITASGNAITGLTYRLTNTGSATVVASQTELRLEEASGARTVILFRFDGFIGGGGVLPGQTLDLTAAMKQELRSPLRRAEMMTTFAITKTGQAFGRNAREIAADLEQIYQDQLRGYDRVQQALAAAPAGQENEVIRSALVELGESGKCNDTLAVLSDAFHQGGVEGLKQALAKKRKLW